MNHHRITPIVLLGALIAFTPACAADAPAPATRPGGTAPAPGSPAALLLDAAALIPDHVSIFPRFGEDGIADLTEADHPFHAALLRAVAAAHELRAFTPDGDPFVPTTGQQDAVQRLANVGMLRGTVLFDAGRADECAAFSLAGLTCARFISRSDTYTAKRREVDLSKSAMVHLTRRVRRMSPEAINRAAEHLNTLPPMTAPADVLRAEAKRLLAGAPDGLGDDFAGGDGGGDADRGHPADADHAGEQPLTPAQAAVLSALFEDLAQVISIRPDEMAREVDARVARVSAAHPDLADSLAALRNFVVDFGRQCTVYEVWLDLTRAAVAVAAGGPDRVDGFRDYFGDGPFAHRPVGQAGAFEVVSDLEMNGEPVKVRVE